MPFQAEELTRIHSEWRANKPEHICNDLKIITNQSFLSLTKHMVVCAAQGPEEAMGAVLAILEVGIAIGRSQATKELLKDMYKGI